MNKEIYPPRVYTKDEVNLKIEEILDKVSNHLHKMVQDNSQNFDWIYDLREEYLQQTVKRSKK